MKKLLKYIERQKCSLVGIAGENHYLVRESVLKIRAIFSDTDLIEYVDCQETPTPELVEVLDQSDFSNAYRVVVLLNAHTLKGKQKLLCQYVSDPNPSTCAVFVFESGKSTPFLKALAEHAEVVECPHLSEKDRVKWSVNYAAQTWSVTLPGNIAQVIVSSVTDDLYAVKNAVEKVCRHCDKSLVSQHDVKANLTRTAETPIYELGNTFNTQDIHKMMRVLGLLYNQDRDPSILIVTSLLNHIERLIEASSLLDYGLKPKEVASILKMNAWAFETKYLPAIKKIGTAKLVKAHGLLCAVDIQCKKSSLPGRPLIETCLFLLLR
tara:strand:- start:981 stop:1949 length:969 start_codon:yes stop_codon:yes gene_type:complete